jgi:uncharacterized protein YaiL (DUF2058 family)
MGKNKKRGGSLQDQLKEAGLVTGKQLRKASKGMHRQEMRVKQGVEVEEDKLAAIEAQASKAASDKQKNEQRDQIAQVKALKSQVKQLVTSNSQRESGDAVYNFSDQNKIKKIYISELNKSQLNKGYLAVVRAGDGYDLVPEKVARKIMERSDDMVLYLYDRDSDVVDEDDPYKDYQIPDDLEW